jgi:polypeptide N-acetylgalactosaminyltransferase
VYSVLNRSDPALLKEIILVNDASTFGHLNEPLTEFVAKLDKVKLVRHEKRQGLIRARLKGASIASAEVLVFLDSHCEATEGWLEPLIDPIARNPNVSTVPIIETISDRTFEYHSTALKYLQVGGFNWNLIYTWHNIPEREWKRRKQITDPVRSPTMAGLIKFLIMKFSLWLNHLFIAFFFYRRVICNK